MSSMKDKLIAAIHREESPGIITDLTERLRALQVPKPAPAAGHRLLPVALHPAIRDAIRESGCFQPETLWAAIVARWDLVAPQVAQSQASAAPTDAQCKLASDLANVETDAWADGLTTEPTSEQIDGFLVRALLRHLGKASAAPVLTDADIERLWQGLNGIEIHNSAARRGVDTQYALRIAHARAIERHLAATPAKTEGEKDLQEDPTRADEDWFFSPNDD